MGEFPGSISMLVNENRVFTDALKDPGSHYAIVIHKTGNKQPTTAQDQAHYFAVNPDEVSVHYVVGKDGTIVQCVLEKDGSGGNCCLTGGYDFFWDSAPTRYNINLCTFSIEHCSDTINGDNSDTLTDAQKESSFQLIHYLSYKYGIGMDHIKGHNTIDPVNRANCPGNYPWSDLFQFLRSNEMPIPNGWKDDGKTLSSPNGFSVVLGFREYVLNNSWTPSNLPLQDEEGLVNVEESDITLGNGTRQIFTDNVLAWTQNKGVFEIPLGQEFIYVKKDRDNCRIIIGELQNQIELLKKGIPSSDVTNLKSSLQKVIDDLSAMVK